VIYFKQILLYLTLILSSFNVLYCQHPTVNKVDNIMKPYSHFYNNNYCYSNMINDTIVEFNYEISIPDYDGELVHLFFAYSTIGCTNIELLSSEIYDSNGILFIGFYLNDILPYDTYIWKLVFKLNTGCYIDYFCPLYVYENPLYVSFKEMKVLEGNIIDFTVYNQVNNNRFILKRSTNLKDFDIVDDDIKGDYYNLNEKSYRVIDTLFENKINYYSLYCEDYNGEVELLDIQYINNKNTKRTIRYTDIYGRNINISNHKGIYLKIVNNTIIFKQMLID
jgi:hypothetical protein